ncbi:hypothetical protein [Chryseobacterium daeguense]|uniref:hypothetical protein n=1 Tax=Chryseobacterium daeguense TaxID=412438 RepID=UPI0012DFDDA0|nr:hypothetical protein [Chryseobacterium daeguense]
MKIIWKRKHAYHKIKSKVMVNWNTINRNVRQNILSYITRNHSGSVVDSIEEKFNAYKINFMNGLSLFFDKNGQYLKKSI